jgi:UDPglucose 6-dehydrogenase
MRESRPLSSEHGMKITVFGLWHLGSVTAGCCARHFDVVGLDLDPATVTDLRAGRPPVSEPGLDTLLHEGLASGRLRFTTDPAGACRDADVLWVTFDTPVDEEDQSDVDTVRRGLARALPHLPVGTLVVISSQLPVGTIRSLEEEYPALRFACSPENLRLGRAIEAFEHADRVVAGVRDDESRTALALLLKPFTDHVLFMGVESAEMVKHALNSFLALSIAFINEVARLSEDVGADARDVSAGLKSDARIGSRAYLAPGGPFAGGTLARDVVTLSRLGAANNESLEVIPAIMRSNGQHRQWSFNALATRLESLAVARVAVLGLTYVPGTNTLRRSLAVELCQRLMSEAASVTVFDPAVSEIPEQLAGVELAVSVADAVRGADAAVICTDWPEFRSLSWPELLASMRRPLLIDANGFVRDAVVQATAAVEYLTVGMPR